LRSEVEVRGKPSRLLQLEDFEVAAVGSLHQTKELPDDRGRTGEPSRL